MHLRQPGFTYSACGLWTIYKKQWIQNIKKTGDSRHVYKNELDKTCFQDNMGYWDFKDLTRRTASDKVLRDKAFSIAKHLKYYGCQKGLASMVYNFFYKKCTLLSWSEILPTQTARDKPTSGSGTKNKNTSNKELAEELHKPIIRKILKTKSIPIFYRQYLECWFSWYRISK